MVRWLQEQGEMHGSCGGAGPNSLAIPENVARMVSMIIEPYTVGTKGRCVLGLLLR